jgi:hypothetical protein
MTFVNFLFIQILALFFKAFVKYVLSEISVLSSDPLESKMTRIENGRFGL